MDKRVDELKRVYGEGLAADVGDANPYRATPASFDAPASGSIVDAVAWRSGYRRMLDTMVVNLGERRAYLCRSDTSG
jgi:hypothetical protein